jgi:hypothetical protein
MPALHDFQCSECGQIRNDCDVGLSGSFHFPKCFGKWEILWRTSSQRDAAVHSSERTALLYSAKEKKFQYPSRNDQPIPDRLKRRGYERVEFSSLKSLEQHGKQTGAISERAWFDKGSGRSMDEG